MAQVSEINAVVAEIAAGAHEQSTALTQVTTAVSQMDIVTRRTRRWWKIDGGQSYPVGRKREACRPRWRFRVGQTHGEAALRSELRKVAPPPSDSRPRGRDPMRVRRPLFSRHAPHRRRSSTARPTTRTAGKNSDTALHRRSRDRDARRRLEDWVRLRQERGANLAPRRPPLLVQGVFQWRRSFVPAIATTPIIANKISSSVTAPAGDRQSRRIFAIGSSRRNGDGVLGRIRRQLVRLGSNPDAIALRTRKPDRFQSQSKGSFLAEERFDQFLFLLHFLTDQQ